MTDKIFALRKALTQSEKERRLFSKKGKTNSIIQGARVVECQQNAVELRKLILQWETLERQKRKAVSDLNTEMNLTKLSFKKLNLKPQKSNEEEDLETITNETNPVGFRFRSNGDIRETQHVSKTAMKPTIEALKGQSDIQQTSTRSKSKQEDEISGESLVTPFGESDESDESEKIDYNEEIAKLEKTVKELSEDVLKRSNSKAAKQYLRAHTREDHSSSYADTRALHYMQMHQNDRWASLPSRTDFGRYSRTDRQMHKKYSLKANCVACELRLKQNDTDKIQSKSLNKPCGRKWNITSRVKDDSKNIGSQWDMSYLKSKMKRQADERKKREVASYEDSSKEKQEAPDIDTSTQNYSTLTVDFCKAPKVWSRSEHDTKSDRLRPKTAQSLRTEVHYHSTEERYQHMMQRALLSSHDGESFDTLKGSNASKCRLQSAPNIGASSARSKSQMSRREVGEIRKTYKEKLVEKARMDAKASDERVNHFLMSLKDKENIDGKSTSSLNHKSSGASIESGDSSDSTEYIPYRKSAWTSSHPTLQQKMAPRMVKADDFKKKSASVIKSNQLRRTSTSLFQNESSKKRRKALTLEQSFKELKDCRYLRNPSRPSVDE
ncbi:unnamed protein product [Owenia fusiformis]|uniref:Uncharacterized protein n=1 Tax=Owenia fusiformis TaxID=6347 RepID=A0A8J1TDV4_OWEFU|nr:unnamed protein product [Owenia fusiformis]